MLEHVSMRLCNMTRLCGRKNGCVFCWHPDCKLYRHVQQLEAKTSAADWCCACAYTTSQHVEWGKSAGRWTIKRQHLPLSVCALQSPVPVSDGHCAGRLTTSTCWCTLLVNKHSVQVLPPTNSSCSHQCPKCRYKPQVHVLPQLLPKANMSAAHAHDRLITTCTRLLLLRARQARRSGTFSHSSSKSALGLPDCCQLPRSAVCAFHCRGCVCPKYCASSSLAFAPCAVCPGLPCCAGWLPL